MLQAQGVAAGRLGLQHLPLHDLTCVCRTVLHRVLECGLYSNNKCTDISQMPNLPFALRSIWDATHDKSLLKVCCLAYSAKWR